MSLEVINTGVIRVALSHLSSMKYWDDLSENRSARKGSRVLRSKLAAEEKALRR